MKEFSSLIWGWEVVESIVAVRADSRQARMVAKAVIKQSSSEYCRPFNIDLENRTNVANGEKGERRLKWQVQQFLPVPYACVDGHSPLVTLVSGEYLHIIQFGDGQRETSRKDGDKRARRECLECDQCRVVALLAVGEKQIPGWRAQGSQGASTGDF